MNALATTFDLAAALVVLPGPRCAVADGEGARELRPPAARQMAEAGPVLVVHAGMTAKRLGLNTPPRARGVFDALELFAFVRPAQFTAPSAVGLAQALGLPEPKGAAAQAATLREACGQLLSELAVKPWPSREECLNLAETMDRAGWAWGPAVVNALRSRTVGEAGRRGSGLDVWARVSEWDDQAPPGEPGSRPVTPEAAEARLVELLKRSGLEEARPMQAVYAAETAFAFAPREREGEPRMVLAEAGTGVGKTLGYLAPASVWAEENGPSVWVSTYTRALQRQIERESAAIYPDPAVRARKAVVRKGRENYLCLLNFQEQVQTAQLGNGDVIGMGLAARWVRASRDGDMTGGDFPAWLPGLFAIPPSAQASAANLVDRRGECVHAACGHYRACFVEKAIRGSRRADLVIANHALVLTQAAFDGARRARGSKADVETASLKRIVFDEGHHLFDAADSAFSAALSGAEAAELRRWIRGPESRGRRGRGLEHRLLDVLGDREEAREALHQVTRAAGVLPGEGWSGRIAPPNGEINPIGPVEAFLAAVLEQLRARNSERNGGAPDIGMECAARPAIDRVRETASDAASALASVEAPLLALARHLEGVLDDEADELATSERARIEGALRGLDRRARMTLPAWRSMLKAIEEDAEDDPDFVDWFDATFLYGRVVDAASRPPLGRSDRAPRRRGDRAVSRRAGDQRHPDRPGVRGPLCLGRDAHRGGETARPAQDPEADLALRLRETGAGVVVTDVAKDDARQVAAAMRELFLAAGGGGVGLFTAIRRLRAVHERIAAPLADKGLALYAQHVDPLEVGALVDIFRAEEDSCLLGTDAVRDGVDVPGRSLRLLAFDRAPWPRPDILHKARRARFGGKSYDDAVARNRIAQAFGRLIRREDDKGVFVMLDAASPTRLFAGLPEGVEIQRVGLVEAIEATAEFLNPAK